MSSLIIEDTVLTVPSGSALGERADEINVRQLTAVNITLSGTINGQAISGTLVFGDSVQTLTNKSFADDTNAFVAASDNTVQVFISADGSTNTSAVLEFVQTADRIYTVPDSGADCAFVMTEGAQTINGEKTFTNINFTTLAIDAIGESTANHGVYIDSIRLREDTLTTPAITLASINPVGGDTNITLSVAPKGSGALIADVPDNAAAGGNVRGTNAVDFQISRAAATQVASGLRSVIISGQNNTSSGDFSVVVGGDTNTASGNCATVPGGSNCSATGMYSVAMGRRAKALNTGSFVLADSTNADFSSTAANEFACRFASGYHITGGPFRLNDSYKIYSGAQTQTTDTTPTTLFTIATTTDRAYLFTAKVASSSTTTLAGLTAVYKKSVRVKNVSGVITIGTPFDDLVDCDPELVTTSIDFTSSGTDILLRVTGESAILLTWRGTVDELSVAFI